MSWFEWTDQYFRDLNLGSLWVDEAFFNITNQRGVDYFLYSLSPDCARCPFKKLRNIPSYNETVLKVNVARNLEFRLFDRDHGNYVHPSADTSDGLHWNTQQEMGQFGVYDLILDESGRTTFETAKEPVNTFTCKLFFKFQDFLLIFIK
jgi:heparan-alpha-glucosaminide N-acetyltransferase